MQKKNKTNKYCDYKNLQAFLKINSNVNFYKKFVNTSKHNENCTSM